MPAKKQTTREDILNAAFSLVRESGFKNFNVREIAKRCSCSTQPVYLSFNSIAEIKAEVFKMACGEYEKFTQAEIARAEYPAYKAVGMAYIEFARREKELFKYLFMQEYPSRGDRRDGWYEDAVAMIMEKMGLSRSQAERLQAEMWVFVHGVGTMCATGYMDWDTETVSKMLTDVFCGVTQFLRGEK